MDILQRFFSLVRAAFPLIDYYVMYFGKVVAWHADDQTVDVAPNDPRLPTMSRVRLRHGIPGLSVDELAIGSTSPTPETSVLIGWENGDPSRSFACLWDAATVKSLTLNADQITLGGTDGAEPAVLGDVLRSILETIGTHTHPPIPSGGGPVLVSTELAELPDPRASNVKVK